MVAIKDIKEEARKKLALNIHQAIVIYTVIFTVFITLIALIVMSCVSLGVNTPAAIVMICYGIVLCLVAIIGSGMINFAMVDFYLASYRCKPYNIRRLGDILARCGITKILIISIKRTLLAFLLLLCLIVPGVIYLIRTSMANNLLIANPKMNASTALSASNKVMSGKTGSYFALCMSMIGWYILGIVTLGLGFVFILPYTNLVKAVYYKRNLQGDKTVYNVAVQPVVAPQQGMYNTNMQNAIQSEPSQNMGQPVVQEGVVVAPIDALADDDIQDMTAAMRDFGTESEEPQVVDVPEVPLTVTYAKTGNAEPVVQPQEQVANEPVAETKVSKKDKKKAAKKNNDDDMQAHAIDGTSLVATERVLTTQEIDASDEMRRQAIEAMYAHTDHVKPKVNYFDAPIEQSPDDFFDVEEEPTQQAIAPEPAVEEKIEPVIVAAPVAEPIVQPIIEPVAVEPVAEPAPVFAEPITESAPVFAEPVNDDPAPIISDSDFDDFLNDFDTATEQQQSEFITPPLTDRASAYDRDRNEPTARRAERPEVSRRSERNDGAGNTSYRTRDRSAAYRRTDEYLADMASRTSRRTPPDRHSAQNSVGRQDNGNNSEVMDRAERTRRELEERLNKNNR